VYHVSESKSTRINCDVRLGNALGDVAVPANMLYVTPDTQAETRRSLHLVFFYALSLARQRSDGQVWAVPMPGGFGSTVDGVTRRIDGREMVIEHGEVELARQRIGTLDEAMRFFGVDFDRARGERNDIEVPERTDEVLPVDLDAAALQSEWYAIGWEVLHRIIDRAGDQADTAPRIWNEHFDLAIELGMEAEGRRASIGFSPGDAQIPEPYVYVSPWDKMSTEHLLPPTHGWGVARTMSESTDPDALEAFLVDALEKLGSI
jgi:hypothetical protein